MHLITKSRPSSFLSRTVVSCLAGSLAFLVFANLSHAQFADLTITNSLTLRAQPTSPVSLEVTAGGGLRLGVGNGIGAAFTLSAPGALLLWDHTKGTFRAGGFWPSDLVPSNIGILSVAFGNHTVASGDISFAAGSYSLASGEGSFAAGSGSVAAGYNSVSLGGYSVASGNGSVAMGHSNYATGYAATAMGFMSTASGEASAALGFNTRAESFASFVIGQFNVGGHSAGGNESWVLADPVFEIGIGGYDESDQLVHKNALTVFKNGNAVFQGVVRVAAGGDIPMFGQP